jgi:hypothetical protein
MAQNCPEAPQTQYIVDSNQKSTSYGRMLQSWTSWFSLLTGFLKNYLTPFGINSPQITKEQRDSITNPQEGSIVYITTSGLVDVKEVQVYINGNWYKFDVTIAP